jgi:hypothetical protein
MMGLRGGDSPYAGSPSPPTRAMRCASATTAFIQAVAGNCEMAPVLPSAGTGDGHAVLQANPAAATAAQVGSLILDGKEASASGHQRDAEIDFLNACRHAAALPDSDGIPLADAMYQLGRHYANVAAFDVPNSTDLFQRAERLYSVSLEAYRARYGEGHEKTKFAQQGLATVQQVTGGKPPTVMAKAAPPTAPAPPPVAAASASAPAPEPVSAAAPAPQQPAAGARTAAAEPTAPAAEEQKPRVQVRRAPERPAIADAEDETQDVPPPPRQPRRVRMPSSEPEMDAPAPPSMGMGAGNGAPTAEGSAGQP